MAAFFLFTKFFLVREEILYLTTNHHIRELGLCQRCYTSIWYLSREKVIRTRTNRGEQLYECITAIGQFCENLTDPDVNLP